MKTGLFIDGTLTYLRPYEEEDIDLCYLGKNNPEDRQTLFYYKPRTRTQVADEIEQWIDSDELVLFTICRKDDDKAIGQTAFFRLDYISRAAVFYIAILDPSDWSRGYGSEVTRLMCDYAFSTLNLNRLQLHVSCENERGVRAYKKAGFEIEGTLRQAMYLNNRYVDFYVMGLLRQDYLGRTSGAN